MESPPLVLEGQSFRVHLQPKQIPYMSGLQNLSSQRSVLVDGQKLRRVRQALGWTQTDAAKRSGYSARLIRKMENGGPISRASLDTIVTAYQEGIELKNLPDLPRILRTNDYVQCTPKDELERVAFNWFDRIFNHRDLSTIDELTVPDVQLIAEGATLQGRKPVRERIEAILNGFNPLRLCVEHLFTDGSTVIIYWQVDATHSGDFLGFPATDKQISIRGSTMALILDNKFVEARDHWDVKHLIDQIS